MLLATAGVLVLRPDSLLVRLISADSFTVLFWRGLPMRVALSARHILCYGSECAPLAVPGRQSMLTSVLLAGSTHCFVQALRHTTVANTLITIGAGPLISELVGWLLLREGVRPRTWLAILGAATGISPYPPIWAAEVPQPSCSVL